MLIYCVKLDHAINYGRYITLCATARGAVQAAPPPLDHGVSERGGGGYSTHRDVHRSSDIGYGCSTGLGVHEGRLRVFWYLLFPVPHDPLAYHGPTVREFGEVDPDKLKAAVKILYTHVLDTPWQHVLVCYKY